MSKKLRVYIAGPMRGKPEWNFPAFHAAAKKLREKGFEVVSPAEKEINKDFDTSCKSISNKFLREVFSKDLELLFTCDCIYMLPGWRDSVGANIEYRIAEYINLIFLCDNESG